MASPKRLEAKGGDYLDVAALFAETIPRPRRRDQ
jgi:hypothetical protein